MMPDIFTVVLFPLAVIVIGLVIEYWVIQPIRKRTAVTIPSSPSISKDWAAAIRKGVKRFQAQQSGYNWNWWSPNRNRVTLEAWKIEKGQATLTLAISEKYNTYEQPIPAVIQPVTRQRAIARHELVIDRTGDILRLTSLPTTIPNLDSLTDFDLESLLPETTVVIKNLKTPVVENIGTEVRVLIEFEVENSGRAGKACPYIEFKVVTTRGDGQYTPKIFRSDAKSFDVPALGSRPIKCDFRFPLPDAPLVKPPNEVKIELYPCPDVQRKL